MDTTVSTPQAVATVIAVEGQAFARDPAGQMRPLKAGDVLLEGDAVVTLAGGQVQLAFVDGQLLTLLPNESFRFTAETSPTSRPDVAEAALQEGEAERIIQALERGEDIDAQLEDTAAGLEGGGDNGGNDFVRLLRIVEGVGSNAFAFEPGRGTVPTFTELPETANTDDDGTPTPINSAPVANTDSATVNEDSAVTINVLANDSDSDGNPLAVESATATNGVVTINPDGTLTYTPAPDFNGTDVITYSVSDGQGGTATTTVNVVVVPTNDAAIIGPGTGSVTEDTAPTTGGTLTMSDIDSGEAGFIAQAATAGAYGTFTLGKDGVWTYTLDNAAVQSLGAGQTLTETFTVASIDGTTSTVTVTINGTNDAAVISSGTGSVTEDTSLSTGGKLSITDADVGQAGFIAQPSTAGAYGTFSIDASGNWNYTLDNAAVQSLGTGQTLTEAFTIASLDGTTSSVSVTINGTNDTAVISSETGSVTEDTALTTGGTLAISDADAGQAGFIAQPSTAGAYGSFSIDASGAWNYALDNAAVQSLGAGQTLTETFTVASLDGTTSSVSVTINGTNDAAVISSGTGSVTEDTSLSTGGKLSITDADVGQAGFIAQPSTAGAYGSFSIDASGNWNYALDNAAVQSLGAGQTLTETFSVASLDGTTSSVSVTINGTNDAAVISSGTGSVTEDGVPTTGGTLTISDVDAGQANFIAQPSTAGAYGTFSVDAAGNWTYALDNAAVQSLGAGQTLTETFSVASLDGTSSAVTVTINGTNDAAVISSGTGSVTEDTALTTGGMLTISDTDAGQANFIAQPSTAGAYGIFTLGTDGAWTYILDNSSPAVQALAEGSSVTETFAVSGADGTSSSVTVTINGTNETFSGNAAGSVQEDTTTAASGMLVASGGAAFVAGTIAGAYGSLSIDASGNWSYALDNASSTVQGLTTADTQTEVFTVSLDDGTTSNLIVTVLGLDDMAIIGGQNAGSVTEDSALTTGGMLTITDVDSGEASFVAQPSTAGAYGTFTLGTDGGWTYTLDNAAVQSLGAGQTLTETFTVASLDGTTSSVSVTINGTNDAAVISSGTGSVTEDGTLTTGGTLAISDVDAGQAGFIAQPSTAGAYGSFSIDASGNWNYALDNAAVQSLGAGQTLTETFSVASVDGTTGSVTVTINGTNDAAVISSGTGSVTEDTALTTGGTLSIADTDAGQAGFVAQPSTSGAYGTFSIDVSGTWNYTLDNAAVQSLGAGQTLTETFTVAAVDGTTSLVSVTINGTNDAAVISSGTGSVTEDGTLTTGGMLTISDVDSGQASFVAQPSTTGAYGTFSVDAAGNWTYALDNAAVQSLGAGQTLTETFSVASVDGTTGSVTVTINGTNDAAVISSGTGSVTEDTALTTGGTLTIGDTDAGQASFIAQAATIGAYGTFTLATNGVWTYALDNAAVQSLGAGQTLTETFTVAAVDGTTSSVSVTINGTNDAAVISSGTGSVTEDGVPTTGGTLTVSDTDAGQAGFIAQPSTAGAYGTFSIDASGNWTYALDNAAMQSLGAGQTLTETFSVATLDGTSSAVTVTINGTNDAAVISSGTGSVTEDAALTTGGILTISDADAAEASFITQPSTAGAYGTFSIDAAGNWNYALDNAAVQSLGAGQTLTETFTVTSLDGTSSSVTVTINGTNDAAVISSGTGSATEDGTLTTGGTLTISDTDAGQASFIAQAATIGAYGTFALGTNGVWSYALNNASVQSLGAGQTLTETFSVAALDGTTSTVTVTINGTNDAAVISSGTGSVTEDGTLTTGGTLTISDTDAGQASFIAQPATIGAYGTFTLATNGVWTYALDNAAVQSLGAGQTLTETFTVASLDGTTSSVSVTINGTNDAAVISSGTGSVTEDGVPTTGGTLTVSDTDAGQAGFIAQPSTAGAYGTFSIDTSGNWTYALDNAAVQSLGAGQTLTETFTVAAVDGTTSSVSVTINGTNDVAVISSGTGSVTEDGVPTTGGTLTISDVDAGQANFIAQPSTAGAYGSFSIDVSGTWNYTLDNAAVQSLGAGQTLTETFTVASLDGTTSSVTVTINGTNDAAVISSGSGAVMEDTTLTTGGTLAISDVDAGQAGFIAQAATVGAYGTFTLGTNGVWTYVLDNAAVQSLGAGQTLTETFSVAAVDGTTSSVTVTINGTNDAAVISSGTGDVTEDTILTTGGTLTISDTDAGQTSFVAQAATVGAYGTFTLNGAGVWSYTLDTSNPAVQALVQGDIVSESFTVTSIDGTASSVTITVNGTNETFSGTTTGTTQEDTAITASGSLAASGGAAFVAGTIAGAYGSLSIDASGNWTYTLENADATVQGLTSADTRTEIFTVSLDDGTTGSLVITVLGLDDLAIIAGPNTGTVTEDTALSTGGTLSIADTDAGQAGFIAQPSTSGAYGTFSIDAAGNWNYALDNAAVQSLGAGQTLTETFTVASLDGTTSLVSVTINGTNDAAVISSGTGSVTEDGTPTTGGTLTISDVDAGQAGFIAQPSITGAYGSFSIDASGTWNYTLDNAAVQSLGAGQTLTETFVVASLDGTASSITVTINGTNDAAVISSETGSVTEDAALTTGGTLTIGDADAGQASFIAQASTAGAYGTFTLATNGVWTYALDNAAVQSLGAGQTLTETFVVASLDGTASSITVTINGTNDAAVISSGTGSVTEDTALTTGGTLSIADTDAGQAGFVAQPSTSGAYGTFSVDVSGTWSYTLDNAAVQSLGAGQTLTETFTVASLDGTTSSVSVTINGTNDAAVISSGTGAVIEDAALTTGGTLTISDTDAGQASFIAQPATVGAYGTFTLGTNGVWTYALDNAAVQSLGAGQTLTETFSVASLDGTSSAVTVTINGTNDAAVISSGTGAVIEDAALTTGGILTISDADSAEASFITQPSTAGAYGTFSIDAAGNWNYVLDNSDPGVQALAAGDAVTEIFTVSSVDGTTSTVTISVNGTNETMSGDTTGSVREDTTLAATGTLATSGGAAFVPATFAGTYGSLTLDAGGNWTYTLDNAAAGVQGLTSSDTRTEVFTVALDDGTTGNLVVTVLGLDDLALIAGQSNGAVTEDVAVAGGFVNAAGTLTLTDADVGQAAFQPASANGAYGSFTVDAGGNWNYQANNANPAIQALAAGQTLTETFTVSSIDGTTSTVTVTINGTNDAAVISSGTGSVTEDTTLTTGGMLTISDTDAGQASFIAQPSTAGAYGTFSIDASGTWNYALDNAAVQSLGAGQTLTETFTIASLDGTTSSVTVTINGTNDAAVISSGTGSVTEDGTLTTGGTLTISDTDAGQASFVAQPSTAGTYGSFSIDASGNWNYALDNAAVQSLGAGQTLTETFTIASLDGTTSSVTVTINGTNDAAVISSGTGSVTEDTALTTGGTLSIADTDAGQAGFIAQPSTAGAYGTFSVDTAGNWNYALDNASVQSLGAGQTLTETFTVASADGTTSSVTVTINGTNDAAVISSGTGLVTEDTVLTTGGTLSIADTDAGQAGFIDQPATIGAYGTFTLATNGVWTYALDNAAVQSLGAGQTLTETFTVAAVDGTTSSVSVTINGTNDAAVISSGTGSVTEDGVPTTGGTLTVSDTDAGQAGFIAQPSTAGAYGTFSIDASGNWTYALDNASAQSLGAGQTLTETFTVAAVDGTTSSVTVTINGTNDAAVISSGTGSVTEDGVPTTGGMLTVSDTDAGQAGFIAQPSTAGAYGTFSIDASGNWNYALDNAAVQSLGAGQTLTETFTVASADGTTSSVTVTINGTNDAAVISSGTGSVTEDSTLTTGGTLTISDVDAGQAGFIAQPSITGAYGSFSIDASGNWNYALDTAAVQSLGAGQTLTETFTVASLDGMTSSVSVTINGVNDAAVISSGTGSVTEDAALTTGGMLTISDVDAGQASFVAQAATVGAYGTFTLGTNGVWTYALDNAAVQSLGAGQTLTETFTVAAVDGTTSSVSVTINGTNDAAVISSGTGAVIEDAALTTGGILTISDADSAEASFITQPSTAGAYGTFSIDAAGNWNYALDNAAVQSLGAGQTLTETFTVTSLDGTSSSVTVTINGTNDAAVISSGTGSVTEDGTLTTGGTLTISDTDAGQASFIAQAATIGAYGTFALGTNGVWSYALNNASVQSLGAGQTLTETFSVAALDGTTSTVTVTINGTNDAAVISSGTGAVIEDAVLATGGALSISDIDAGQAAFVAQTSTSGTYGSFTLGANGAWTYALNNSTTAVQALANGESVTETFSVAAIDGTTSSVTVTVNGANDAPVNTLPATFSTNEDSTLKLNGLSVTDVDAGSRIMTVTLSVSSGTLAAASGGGVTVADAGTGSLVLTGTLAAINAYLGATATQPSFTPAANDSSTVSLTMSTSDGGNGGVGALIDTDSSSILVAPVADAIPASAASLVIGAPLSNTINFGSAISGLDGATSYTFPSGITMSTGTPGTVFDWSTGSLLSVQTAGVNGDGRIAGTDAVVFDFPYGMQYLAMKVKNAGNDTLLVRSDLEVGDLISGSLSGQITSSSNLTVSSANIRVNLLLDVTNGATTSTVTLAATVSSGGTWTIDYSGVTGTITGATVISLIDGDLYNQGGNTSANVTFSISSDMTSLSIGQDPANTFSAGQTNDGFQIEYVDIKTSSSGATTYSYPIDLYATIQDTVGATESFTRLTLSEFPAGATLSIVHADGSYTEISPVNGVYDLSVYTDLLNTPTGTAGTDKLYLVTDSLLAAGFAPTLTIEVSDGGNSSALTISGGSGSSDLTAGTGNDYVSGGAGNDTLDGGAGNDILLGGTSGDTFTGGLGADVFKWELADRGTPGTPAIDTVTDFDTASNSDKLDLRDLLVGESHAGFDAGNLANYLHFEVSGSNTVIQISSTGGFAGGYSAGATDQRIVLNNADLTAGGTLSADQQIIQDLLTKSKLITD